MPDHLPDQAVLAQPTNRGGSSATQRARAINTRAALLSAARDLFASMGYNGSGIGEVVTRAAVTRGALYHHFAGKEGLFEAVFRDLLGSLNAEAQAIARSHAGSYWDRVVAGFTTYLHLIAGRRDAQRVLLIDGPAVFGWRRWRGVLAEYIAADVEAALEGLMRRGIMAVQPIHPLDALVLAALNEAALSIAHAEQPEAMEAPATAAFVTLLSGLRRGS